MKKTLILAATLTSLAAGAAFANSNAPAQPTQASSSPMATGPKAQDRLFPASSRAQTNIYSMFPGPGTTQEASR